MIEGARYCVLRALDYQHEIGPILCATSSYVIGGPRFRAFPGSA
jgi:hypothetical protein